MAPMKTRFDKIGFNFSWNRHEFGHLEHPSILFRYWVSLFSLRTLPPSLSRQSHRTRTPLLTFHPRPIGGSPRRTLGRQKSPWYRVLGPQCVKGIVPVVHVCHLRPFHLWFRPNWSRRLQDHRECRLLQVVPRDHGVLTGVIILHNVNLILYFTVINSCIKKQLFFKVS